MSQISHYLVFKLSFDGLKVGLMCYLPNCPHNLGGRVRTGRLAARVGLPAGQPGSARRAAGQYCRARACERGGRAQEKAAEPALGHGRGGFSAQIHILADRRGCPLCLRVTGSPRHDST